MQRQEASLHHIQNSDQLQQRSSLDQEFAVQQEQQELLISESKTQELNRSVDRLREFVTTLSEEQATLVPACLQDYFDKTTRFRVKNKAEVLQIAQRRVSKMLHNGKIKRNWSTEDVNLLVWLVSQRVATLQDVHIEQMSKQDWYFISNMISGSTWQKCKFKWLGLKKVKLTNHKWTKDQQKMLNQVLPQQSKINWKQVSEKLYERNSCKDKVFRTAKQCREHWNCFLNPSIQKGPWTWKEDRRLLQFVIELQGSKRWTQIAKYMEGRTENALKNRFNLLVSRQRKVSGHLTQKRLLKICLSKLLSQGEQEKHNLQLNSRLRQCKREEKEQNGSQYQESKKSVNIPTIPTMASMPTIPSPHYPQSHLNYTNSYQNLVHTLNNSVDGRSSYMIPQSVVAPNTMFYGFVFQTHFDQA